VAATSTLRRRSILDTRFRFAPFLPLIPVTTGMTAWHWAMVGYLAFSGWRQFRSNPTTSGLRTILTVAGGLACASVLLSRWVHGDSFRALVFGIVLVSSLVGTALYALDRWEEGERGWLIVLGLSLAFAPWVYLLVYRDPVLLIEPWKFYLGVPIGFAVFAFIGRRRERRPVGMVMLGSILLAVVSVVLSSRSLALFFVLTGLLAFIQDGRGRALRRLATFLVCLLVVLVTTLIPLEDLPASTVHKFQTQAAINPNPLLAGRTELPISLATVSDNALWGVGSTARPYPGLVSVAKDIAYSMGYSDPSRLVSWWTLNGEQIVTHSVLFDAWVRWGFFAALPFLIAWVVLLRGTWRGRHGIRAVDAPFLFVTILSVWDVIFSPARADRTALIGFAVAYAIALQRGMTGSGVALGSRSRVRQIQESPQAGP
jgi:hypothetical protein